MTVSYTHLVLQRRVAGLEQVLVGGAERPVVVLAASVGALERLLVQQAHQVVADVYKRQHMKRAQARPRTRAHADTPRSCHQALLPTRPPARSPGPVSYTHLDVYKRQGQARGRGR